MNHKPECKTNWQCLVVHENGICPDVNKCTCNASANASESDDWEERFDENIPKMAEGAMESKIYPFGYKYITARRDIKEIGTVTDWTNIKAFIKEEIQKAHQKGRYEAIEFYEQKKIPEAEKRAAEKIIDDIPDDSVIEFNKAMDVVLWGKNFKQQLRDKYLKGDNE